MAKTAIVSGIERLETYNKTQSELNSFKKKRVIFLVNAFEHLKLCLESLP